MAFKWVGTLHSLAILTALAACENGLGRNGQDNPFPPRGKYDLSESVDGLVVGHRLMNAGEYDLALDAYYRAAGRYGLTADTLSAIGSAQLKLGRLGQAEKTLRDAVKKDGAYPAAWNNLGVVLIEQGKSTEAEGVFRKAFALDSGRSTSIRDNLRLAIAMNENSSYVDPQNNNFELVRRGSSEYLLLSSP